MKKIILYILFIFCSLGFKVLYAQNPVKGIITSVIGNPVEGATVLVKSNKQIAITSSDGTFSLNNATIGDMLTITCIGFSKQDIKIKGAGKLFITLLQTTSPLDEVVIQAYGTTTQRKNTGNITTVLSKDIESQPVSNPLAALIGRVPGVIISQSSGVPGSSFNVEIRGRSSLDQSLSQNNPLIVIDGVLFEPGNMPSNRLFSAANNQLAQGGLSPLNSINPSDIASIEVLKDADATAIYGSRGANGVILITTKKGKEGRTELNASVYSGWSNVTRTMDMLNTEQYIQMRKEGYKNDGITPSNNPLDAGYAPDIMLWDTTRYTDFKKLFIGNTALTNDAQLSITGGNALTQFRIGGGYHKETNVFSNDLADIRSSLNFNLNHTSKDGKLTVLLSGGYSNDQNKLISNDLTQYINLPPNLLLRKSEGELNYEEDGVSFATVNNIVNPLAVFEKKVTAVTGNLYGNLQINYRIWQQLIFKTSLSYNNFKIDETGIYPQSSIDPFTAAYIKASSSFANTSTDSWVAEPQLTYAENIGSGILNVLVGGTWQEKKYKANVIQATNFANDLLLANPAAAGTVSTGIDQSIYRYTAIFSRVNYNWQGKYLLNLTFRRDGSSRFGPDRQFANFGAAGAGWIFTDESYFKRHWSFLSFGKLRASYGITGNDQIGDYNYLKLWQNSSTLYQGQPTLSPTKLYNPDFGWETNKKLETAIELGFIKDRIFLSVSGYRQRSSNQLINYSLPRQTGSLSVVMNMPALVENSGLELLLTTKNIAGKQFSWTSSLNATVPRNKLISFPNLASTSYRNIFVEGQPLSVVKGYKYLGVDPNTGLYTFNDINGDGILNTANDYQVLGNLNPKFYGGLTNSIRFRQFQLDFLFEFKKQKGRNYLAQIYNSFPGTVANQPVVVLNRWQPGGNQLDIQKYTAGSNSLAIVAANTQLNNSDGIYGDASYIRLKNTSFAYNLPEPLIHKLKSSSGRIYINGQNLLTITKFQGLDPETQDFYVLPPLRTIVAGVQLTF